MIVKLVFGSLLKIQKYLKIKQEGFGKI